MANMTNQRAGNKYSDKKTLWPFFMDNVQQPQGCRATTRTEFTFYHLVTNPSYKLLQQYLIWDIGAKFWLPLKSRLTALYTNIVGTIFICLWQSWYELYLAIFWLNFEIWICSKPLVKYIYFTSINIWIFVLNWLQHTSKIVLQKLKKFFILSLLLEYHHV